MLLAKLATSTLMAIKLHVCSLHSAPALDSTFCLPVPSQNIQSCSLPVKIEARRRLSGALENSRRNSFVGVSGSSVHEGSDAHSWACNCGRGWTRTQSPVPFQSASACLLTAFRPVPLQKVPEVSSSKDCEVLRHSVHIRLASNNCNLC